MTMLASPLDLSNLGTTAGSTTGVSGNTSNDPQAMQDRFLKLLVAQINNQDPLNPMDNAQMTTQMAQINTVSGIQQLNQTLKGMADQMASSQAMQGTTLIGKDALVEGDTLAIDGGAGKGAFALDASASNVKVDIIGKNGETLDTIDLGKREPGQHGFEWPAGAIDPTQVAKFAVRATNGTAAVESTELARVRIASVGLSNGAMNIQLQNGRTLSYDQVRGFM
jgi:flagellar basal-body rod modification protein FlgD